MRQKGVSQIPVLIILIILIIAAGAGSYYLLKQAGKLPASLTGGPTPSAEISDSDDADVIESELEATTVDSVDSELNDLETDASSL